MTIIYLGAFRFPTQDAGAQRVLNNAKLFRLLGHKVLICSWGGNPREEDLCNNGRYYYEGFEYINTGEIRSHNVHLWRKIMMYFYRGTASLHYLSSISLPDVIIAYNANAFFNWKCSTFCKKNNIVFISDITEWYAANELGGLLSPNFWLNEWNMKFIQKRIKNKILISSYLSNYYHSHNIVLPSLIDLSIYSNKHNISSSNSVELNNRVKFIYAGSPAKKDLLSTVIKAFINVVKKYNNIEFYIIGVDGARQVENLDVLSIRWIESDKDNHIIFKGRIPYNNVSYYYQMCDCSIIVRERNRKNMSGFPTKSAESLVSGCPILYNETSDLSSYLKDGINSIKIENECLDSVEKGLMRLLSMTKEERWQLKKQALYSAKKLDYKSFATKTEKWLNSIKRN